MAATSSHLLTPPVWASQQPHHLSGSAFHRLGPLVLRRRPCRVVGVISPIAGSSLTSRADLAGSARAFGSLFFRVRSCLQALTVSACAVVRAASLIRLRPICPHLDKPCFRVTLTSSHGGLFKCGQKLPGNEQ